jgi:hypothetical protein
LACGEHNKRHYDGLLRQPRKWLFGLAWLFRLRFERLELRLTPTSACSPLIFTACCGRSIPGAVLPHSIHVLKCQAKHEKPLRNAAAVVFNGGAESEIAARRVRRELREEKTRAKTILNSRKAGMRMKLCTIAHEMRTRCLQ